MERNPWRRRNHQPHVPDPHLDTGGDTRRFRVHRHHPGGLGDRQPRTGHAHRRQCDLDDRDVLPGHAGRRRGDGRLHPLDGAHLRRHPEHGPMHRVRHLHRHPAVHRRPGGAVPAPVAGNDRRHGSHLLHGVPAVRGPADLHEHPVRRGLSVLEFGAGGGAGGACRHHGLHRDRLGLGVGPVYTS